MNEDQLVANKTTITLASNDLDLNLYIPDVNWYAATLTYVY